MTETISGQIGRKCTFCGMVVLVFFTARKIWGTNKWEIEEINPPMCTCGQAFDITIDKGF